MEKQSDETLGPTGIISFANAEAFPNLLTVLACAAMFRLAGSHTFVLEDLRAITGEYPGLRVGLNPEKTALTVTLVNLETVRAANLGGQ